MDFLVLHKVEVFALLFAASELLAYLPFFKSNSVGQLILNLLKSVFAKPQA